MLALDKLERDELNIILTLALDTLQKIAAGHSHGGGNAARIALKKIEALVSVTH
jgi:hypothetical protein